MLRCKHTGVSVGVFGKNGGNVLSNAKHTWQIKHISDGSPRSVIFNSSDKLSGLLQK